MTALKSGERAEVHLPAGHVLTIIASAGASGLVIRLGDRAGEPSQGGRSIASEETVAIGPFATPTRHEISCRDWTLTYGIAPAAFAVEGATVRAIDPPAGFVELFGDGAPVAPAQAEVTIDPDGDDNAIDFTAVAYGDAGNLISVEYREQAAELAALSVEVNGNAIIVHLEMDDSEPPEPVSTAAEVIAAIDGSEEASALVTVAANAVDENATGSVGTVPATAATFLENGEGTGVGIAGPGSRYTDYDTPALYINTGDADEPSWSLLAFD